MPSFRLDGQVAIVTGGSRGLGLGIARALAVQGADLVLAARGADELDRAAATLRALGRRVVTVAIDIGTRDAPDRLVSAAVDDELGRLDILVNGAGINVRKPAASFTREDFAGVLAHQRRGGILPLAGGGPGDAAPGTWPHHLDRIDRPGGRRAQRRGLCDEQGGAAPDDQVAVARMGQGQRHR